MDQMLSGLFGSNDNDDDARRQTHASDFVQRYETGLPHEGYSDEEAVHNYRQVASRLSPQQYEEAAGATFGRMSKEERRELRHEMKQRSGGRFAIDSDDPHEMARAAAQYHQQDQGGGGLAGLFGLGGGQSQAGYGQQSAQQGSMLDNPLAKVAMGGIAAMAMKKMMGGR
jgi:hypothetical protein